MKKILIGYSGGLDSTAVMLDFKDRGFDVIALYMQLTDNQEIVSFNNELKKLGIQFDTIDLRKEFRENVISYFIETYKKGLTPNPCIMCNRMIKFKFLSEIAEERGCDGFSTGHYVCIDNCKIKNAHFSPKDQSYFLSTIKKGYLKNFINSRNCICTKEENRIFVESRNFPYIKRESQEICFIKGNYTDFLEKHVGFNNADGNFIDKKGNKIGEYDSYYKYTIGKRKGLKQGFNQRMYVKRIDPEKREILLSDKMGMKFVGLKATIIEQFSQLSGKITVKTRYKQKEVGVRNITIDDNIMTVQFSSIIEDVSPGQIAVLYKGDEVILSAVITDYIERK